MKQRIRNLLAGLLAALMLALGMGRASAEDQAMEETIVYENSVVEDVKAQLAGLNLEAIRAKEGLILDKDIEEIQDAVQRGALSYEELTAFYLDRIARLDKGEGGINAVIVVNREALAQARKLDGQKTPARTPMFGMPVLLKDNINTADLPTSGGTLALKDFQPAQDAPLVARLREQGAIILGKANLSELANFVDFNMPNGYSSRIGQTHNPLKPLMISPLGSSSGSAAAVALNLCAASLGTETTGSIIAPAYIHSLVGLKPTKGMISTEGVLPLSSTMDAVGPIARSVKDAVAMYNAALQDQSRQISLKEGFSLKGRRIGLLSGEENARLRAALEQQGATVVDIGWAELTQDNGFIIFHDFARDFAAYAEKHGAPVKSLKELLDFNRQDLPRRAKYGQELIEEAAAAKPGSQQKVDKLVQGLQAWVREQMQRHQLDALAFVNDQACHIPATAGFPVVTVPLGQSAQSIDPLGASFFGDAGREEQLMNLAHAFEQATKLRIRVQ